MSDIKRKDLDEEIKFLFTKLDVPTYIDCYDEVVVTPFKIAKWMREFSNKKKEQ